MVTLKQIVTGTILGFGLVDCAPKQELKEPEEIKVPYTILTNGNHLYVDTLEMTLDSVTYRQREMSPDENDTIRTSPYVTIPRNN